jgi:hypothetical protein
VFSTRSKRGAQSSSMSDLKIFTWNDLMTHQRSILSLYLPFHLCREISFIDQAFDVNRKGRDVRRHLTFQFINLKYWTLYYLSDKREWLLFIFKPQLRDESRNACFWSHRFLAC